MAKAQHKYYLEKKDIYHIKKIRGLFYSILLFVYIFLCIYKCIYVYMCLYLCLYMYLYI